MYLEKVLALADPESAHLRTLHSWEHREHGEHRLASVSKVSSVARRAPSGMRPASPEDRKTHGIPPAYSPAFVASDPNAAMIWRGWDSKGRMKSEYSSEFKAKQSALKFNRIVSLNNVIGNLDKSIEKDAMTDDTAACMLLMRRTGMRPGSDTDTGAEKKAYGASTLLRKHASVSGGVATFTFVGKNGKDLTITSSDPLVVKSVQARLAGDPEGKLFGGTNSAKLLTRIKKDTGDPKFKVKDLRTYFATAMALHEVASRPKPTTKTEFRKARLDVAREVSKKLGNTPVMALNAYINPASWDSWVGGSDWL